MEIKETKAMKLLAAVLTVLACFSGVALATDPTGRMEFPAKNGTVVFNHKDHVKTVQGHCKFCHDSPGEIKDFGKTVAHKLCIGCHRPPGEEALGPFTCDGCHGIK